MALVELTMPALGEGIIEATVLRWLKQVGDAVEEEESILEIATDKVDSEVPSTVNGILKEIFFTENQVAAVGAIIARIETGDDANKGGNEITTADTTDSPVEDQSNLAIPYIPENNQVPANDNFTGSNNGFYSPLVLSIAKKEGINFEELAQIQGTGNEGRLTKKDLLNYLPQRNSNKGTQEAGQSIVSRNQAQETKEERLPLAIPANTSDEIIQMDRMRKLIAHHMKDSQNISATVTSFSEVDVTNMVEWRNKMKKDFESREKTKLTFTPMFLECIARIIRRYPFINSSVDGDNIILKKNIHLGMATALPNGNLIVPVIKNADHLSLVGLCKAVNDMASKARNNNLKPSDTQEGTFTVTNVGSFGSLTGTPIINQPQVAILAIGTIKKRPVVIETLHGDTIGIRHMMILSLSYDHRIIDGALGSRFLQEIVNEIEQWDIKRSF